MPVFRDVHQRAFTCGSCHSKLDKRCIVYSTLLSSVRKCCHHLLSDSSETQLEKVRKSGFLYHMLNPVTWSPLKSVKYTEEGHPKIRPERSVVVRYLHKITHELKKVGVNLVFSAPNKPSGFIAYINGKAVTSRHFSKAHSNPLSFAWER